MESLEHQALPVVVAAPAEVDATNAADLGAAVLAAKSSCPAVVVDMSQTVFCDSAGVRALALTYRACLGPAQAVWQCFPSIRERARSSACPGTGVAQVHGALDRPLRKSPECGHPVDATGVARLLRLGVRRGWPW